MSILLVRHGETALNASRVVQPQDTPLSARGRAQAQRLSLRLSQLGVAAIVSSHLPRARQTAEAIAQAVGCELSLWPELQERNFGLLRGTAYSELPRDTFAPHFRPPEGETLADLEARVERTWQRVVQLRSTLKGPLVVVTHGLFCRTLSTKHLRDPDARFNNTSLTVIAAVPPHQVELLNCTSHLDDLPDAQ